MNELRALVRAFCADTLPMSAVRERLGAGYDPALWRRFAGELGLAGLAVPEEYGGAGQTLAEVGDVQMELGRALAGLPFLSSAVLATYALLGCDDEDARKTWLPRLASGETTGTLVSGDVRVAGGRLSGTAAPVLDGATAGLLLVVAGDGLYVAEDARRIRLESLDATRPLASLTFDGTEARRIGGVPSPVPGLAALAAEMAGGARRAMEMAVEYAKVREQFGRPIGAYQAVKHACAELLVDVEAAASLAAWACAEPGAEAASTAKAYCGDAFVRVATECVQIHGGIGFTWEHDAHLYFKRAHASRVLLGTSEEHYERIG
ncbi:acyl-CoA dehydrogenase family protein [Actinomadura hibisca]|uniref:acyl-CoA dehydrogenase family protein n=1 Tax=Actinomadura hibisca TaxID=68565 RepID=UPI0008334E4A|nr:acyl-CoA dehydrogenase family protein [Actinomadura hibisca]